MTKTLISRKIQKARLTFAEEHVVWTEENWSKVLFSNESKFNLFGSNGNILTEAQVRKEISERWSSLQQELDLLYRHNYTDTWQSECKCLSEPPSAIFNTFPAISQSAYNFHARQCPCHTAKQVNQLFEAKNIKIMKWPAQSDENNYFRKKKSSIYRLLSNFDLHCIYTFGTNVLGKVSEMGCDLRTAEGVVHWWYVWVPEALHILKVDDLTLHTYMGQDDSKSFM